MTEISTLDNLKQLILVKTGLKLISPSDCKAISLSIQKELNKNISETTIKRLFGFATTTTNFSKFTINALTEFVTNSDEPKKEHLVVSTNSIEKIAFNAHQITNCTLQNIKSRCSVPYELTIARKFAHYDFHYFYESDHSFTAFVAQPGYGKTILLSHLVQHIITNEEGNYTNDIVCYFDANQVFDIDNNLVSLEDSIKLKIGLFPEVDLVKYFETQYRQSGTRLLLFFDGFAELVLNKNSKTKIFDRIVDLIAAIDESNGIKIVLSMRSTTWNRFFERIRHAHFLKRKWFPGSYYYLDYNCNVPPLSEKELELVFEKMDPGKFKRISQNLKSQLKFPFHIQWYYRLREQYPTFNSYTNVTFYEIIELFINEKIYKSNYATEKILFCKQIVKLTDFSKKGSKLVKTDLMQNIAVYKNAYMELLADGILMEEMHFYNGYPVEYVRFIHSHIFEYFLFSELLTFNELKLDEQFFKQIQDGYLGNQVRFQLLQWLIRQLAISDNFKEISYLFRLDLTNYEKNYLIYFIAESLSYRCINNPEAKEKIKEQQIHRLLINELVHFDFVDSCYEEAVICLLETVDTLENAQIYNSILAIIECLSFDHEKISDRLRKMAAAPLKTSSIFNAYEIINLILLKLQGVPVDPNHEILTKMNALKRGEIVLNATEKKSPDVEEFIEYLLIILLNVFYGTQKDLINIIQLILKSYPKLKSTKTSFFVYLLNTLAMVTSRISPSKKTDQLERIIIMLYENKNRNKPTLYVQSLLIITKAQQKKNKKEYATAIVYAKEAISIFKRNNLFMYELLMYNLMIAIYTETHNLEKANQYNYKKLTRLEEKGIPLLSLAYMNF